jgi:hypothetical protein
VANQDKSSGRSEEVVERKGEKRLKLSVPTGTRRATPIADQEAMAAADEAWQNQLLDLDERERARTL